MDTTVSRSNALHELLGVLARRKWTIGVVFALVMLALLPLFLLQPPLYAAEARVLIEPLPSAGTPVVQDQPNVQTESQVVASQPVADRVKQELGIDRSAKSLLSGLEVQPIPESDVLALTYTSRDPVRARDIVNSFANNYIEVRRVYGLVPLRSASASLKQRIASVQRQITRNVRQVQQARRAGDGALLASLDAERSVLITNLGALQQARYEIMPESSIVQAASRVLEPATVPSSPSSPDIGRDATVTTALALLMALGTAFLRERLDTRLRSRTGAARILDLPVLALIPRFRPERGRTRGPIVLADPQAAASEAYRTLWTTIEFNTLQLQKRTILITSASRGEGKTETTANLGAALAQAGKRVVVVSADLRHPTLETYFAVNNRVGFSTWFMDATDDVSGLVQESGVAAMSILASGPLPPNPTALLASSRLTTLLAQLQARWDWVLVDSPPMLGAADSLVLAARIPYSILVLSAPLTRHTAALQAKEQIVNVGGQVIGSVLNQVDSSSSYDADRYLTSMTASGTNGSNGDVTLPRRKGPTDKQGSRDTL